MEGVPGGNEGIAGGGRLGRFLVVGPQECQWMEMPEVWMRNGFLGIGLERELIKKGRKGFNWNSFLRRR